MSVKQLKLPPIDVQDSDKEVQQNMSASISKGSVSYILSGPGTKHTLPSQESLQPNQDTKSGEIETWPAYASRNTSDTAFIARSFSKNKTLTVVKKSVIPKPKFLLALENYVRKEIVRLNCTDPEPSELRLQAYREVFEYLIEDFKTYKPLLAQIKNEYEKMLSSYRQQIRELEPLKAMLITVSEQCDQKILAIREEERQDIMLLKKTKMDLLKHIDSMKEKETSLCAQVAKLQEDLAREYKKYRNESDMRKLLISDMNDLRHQQEDLKRAAGQAAIDADDDPVRLKLALKVAHEDLTRQADQLTRILADYGDVVPRRDFQMLETKHTELTEQHETLQSDFNHLKSEHETLLDIHNQVLEQRDEFYTEAEKLRRSATPRPQWRKCADVIPAGPERWEEISAGKTSEQLLEALLDEFKSGGPKGPDTFEGRGLAEDVPKFLQYEGTVRNRNMTKPELSQLLKEIWAKKVASDAERGSREKMSDFLHTFFLEKFNNMTEMASEWGYSLYEALNNFSELHHVKILLDIINEQATEDLYYWQMDNIKKLMMDLQILDVEKTDRITQAQFATGICTSFPMKTESSVNSLVASALEELEGTPDDNALMEYKALFTEDEDGNNGPFLNTLRAQDEEERSQYIEEVSNQLEGVDPVPVSEIRSTLMLIDPVIDQPMMFSYLQIAYKCEHSELEEAEPIDKSVLLDRFKNGGVHRIGPVY